MVNKADSAISKDRVGAIPFHGLSLRCLATGQFVGRVSGLIA